jgi:hypothetical protein
VKRGRFTAYSWKSGLHNPLKLFEYVVYELILLDQALEAKSADKTADDMLDKGGSWTYRRVAQH